MSAGPKTSTKPREEEKDTDAIALVSSAGLEDKSIALAADDLRARSPCKAQRSIVVSKYTSSSYVCAITCLVLSACHGPNSYMTRAIERVFGELEGFMGIDGCQLPLVLQGAEV